MKIYTVLDEKARIYQNPFYEKTDEAAKRAFMLASQNPNTILGLAPADFSLHCIGEFDDVGGNLLTETPRLIMRGTDIGDQVDGGLVEQRMSELNKTLNGEKSHVG